MPPNNPMTEGEALAVLRELRDTGDVSDWQAMESALTMAIDRLTAHTAASGGEVVAWQGRRIDPEEGPGLWWNIDASQVDLTHRTGYEVRALYTAPPAAVPVDALERLRNDMMDVVSTCDDIGLLGAYVIGFSNRIAALIPKGADHEQR